MPINPTLEFYLSPAALHTPFPGLSLVESVSGRYQIIMSEEKRASPAEHPNAAILLDVSKGFDYLFSDDIASAKKHFEPHSDPIHLLGLGVCTFLEAALALESGLMTEASRCLTLAEAGARKQMRSSKPSGLSYCSRFQHGLEWEVLHADAVMLLGLTHALSESYMGYLQCMYALKSSDSKFSKLFKIVFPNGLPPVLGALNQSPISPKLHTPQTSPVARSLTSTTNSTATSSNFFSRWIGMSASTPTLPLEVAPDGPVEDLIVSGTAFGFGLFNLIFSLLPKKMQSVVGFFGFQHDRSRALEALAISSAKLDLHGVFASLVLITYSNMILALSGYQADEQRLLREVEEIVSRVEKRYPSATLLILNTAKVKRMAYDAESTIRILRNRLQSDRPQLFVQADIMMYFELAWTLLSQRRYPEAAEAFSKVTKLNSWSHGTYSFLIAGCLLAAGEIQRAQALFDNIPAALEQKKKAKRELPTEVYIKRKLAFYKEKQCRRDGDSKHWIEVVKINPAEEIGIFWNIHSRVKAPVAQALINDLMTLTPPVSINELRQCAPTDSTHNHAELVSNPSSTRPAGPDSSLVDLDCPDELAIRALLLGINYRTQSAYEIARGFLAQAPKYQVTNSTWVAGIAVFEMVVLDLKETEARTKGIIGDERRRAWTNTLKGTSHKLDYALSLSGSAVDLSGRLESRVMMLRDEIAAKAVIEGITF